MKIIKPDDENVQRGGLGGMISEPIYKHDNMKMAASAPSAPVTKMRFTAVVDPVLNDPKLY